LTTVAYPSLTLTDIYNVLAQIRAGESLDAGAQKTHDEGLVSVLRDLHDGIDEAVFEAYGWATDLSDEDILFGLVDLNSTRAAEERSGVIRWLRPEFQKTASTQTGMEMETEEVELGPKRIIRLPWPSTLPERVRAIRDSLLFRWLLGA
jgi:hypothetical protein